MPISASRYWRWLLARANSRASNGDSRGTSLWMPLNPEPDQGLLWVVDRVVFHKPPAGYRVWESNRNVSLSAFENMEDKCTEGAGGRLSRKCELIYSSRRERPHRMGESGGER